jgi:hypothetical protein
MAQIGTDHRVVDKAIGAQLHTANGFEKFGDGHALSRGRILLTAAIIAPRRVPTNPTIATNNATGIFQPNTEIMFVASFIFIFLF